MLTKTRESGRPEHAAPPGRDTPITWELRLESGPEAGRTIEVGSGWSRVGRSPSATIQLNATGVSRRHALLIRTPEGRLQVLDDRSQGGTFVNGERVWWASVVAGDVLRMGSVALRALEVPASPAA